MRWHHSAIPIFLLVEHASSAAVVVEGSISGRSKMMILQGRGTDVTKDNFFIPAIVTSAVLVVICLVCLYFLDCCRKSRKSDAQHYSMPADNNTSTYQPPPPVVYDKFSQSSPSLTPSNQLPPQQRLIPPSTRLQQLETNQINPQLSGSSHGYLPPGGYLPPNHFSPMHVQHINPSANRYSPPSNRMSVASSSTNVGNDVHSIPGHSGDTLSYLSSQRSVPQSQVWDNMNLHSTMMQDYDAPLPPPPDSKKDPNNYYPGQTSAAYSGPPAYADDKSRSTDVKGHKY